MEKVIKKNLPQAFLNIKIKYTLKRIGWETFPFPNANTKKAPIPDMRQGLFV